MENKVIDIAASSITADRATPQIIAAPSITELSTGVYQPDSLQTTIADIGLLVNLTGYGQESISSGGQLFVRPNEYANIATIGEILKQALNSQKLETTIATELARKVVSLGKIETASVTEYTQLLLSALRTFLENSVASDTAYKGYEKSLIDNTSISELNSKLISPAYVDNITTSERWNTAYAKSVLETLLATDDVYGIANADDDQTASMIKVVEEYSYLSEVRTTNVSKTLLDSYAASELLAANTQKVLLETSILTDAPIFVNNFIREYTDSILSTDDFYGIANADDDQTATLIKVVLEQVSPSEQYTKVLSKVYNEQALLVETYRSVLEKIFLDNLLATDDFYGLANTDDDQTAAFDKVLKETLPVTDTTNYLVVFNRNIVDIPIVTEILASNVSKVPAADTFTSTESASKYINSFIEEDLYFAERYVREKFSIGGALPNDLDPYFTIALSKIDSSVLSETYSKVVSKLLLETSSISETLYSTSSKSFLETAATFDEPHLSIEPIILDPVSRVGQFPDIKFYTFNKGLLETANYTDTLSFNNSITFIDNLLATDDFYGLANTDDDQTAAFDKVLKDNLDGVVDSIVTLITSLRTFTDSGVMSESHAYAVTKGLVEPTIYPADVASSVLVKAPNAENIFATHIVEATISSSSGSWDYFLENYVPITYMTGNIISSDLSTALYNKSALEAVTSTEQYLHTYIKATIEQVALQEVPIIVLGSVIPETLAIQETKYISSGKVTTESVATIEYATANIQNYFPSNFAQVGYVGTNFTL